MTDDDKRPPIDPMPLVRAFPRDRDTLTEFSTAAYEAALHMQEAIRRIGATMAFLDSAAVAYDLRARGLDPKDVRALLAGVKVDLERTKWHFDRQMFGEHFKAPERPPEHGGGQKSG